MAELIFVGLGPGHPDLLTRAAWDTLQQTTSIYTTVPEHPSLATLPPAHIHPFSDNNLHTMANHLVKLATNAPICCALPGHPRDNPITATVQHMIQQKDDNDNPSPQIHLRMVPGISLVDSFCEAFQMYKHDNVQIVDGYHITKRAELPESDERPWCEVQDLGEYTVPNTPYPINPTQPVLIWFPPQSVSTQTPTLATLQQLLLLRYPAHHPIQMVQLDQQGEMHKATSVELHHLSQEAPPNYLTAFSIAPLLPIENSRSLEGLAWVVMRLLGPGGCPWDRKQTFQTLRFPLLEETYEVLEALDSNDMALLAEELGDLLVQPVIQSEMARQASHFDLGDVVEHIHTKLVRRHPHVFGHRTVKEEQEVLHRWEEIKAQELQEKGRQRRSVLDGIPNGLPALATAQKMEKKAIQAGFSWDNRDQVWAKLHEELEELLQAHEDDQQTQSPESRAHLAEELGDVLFMTAILAQWFQLDAESSLRESTKKFRKRFSTLENLLEDRGLDLQTMTLEQKLALWDEAKQANNHKSDEKSYV